MKMAENKEISVFKTLVVKAHEGVLSQEESVRFYDFMRLSENRKIYFEMIKVNCALRQMESEEFQYLNATDINSTFNTNIWERLAEYEKTAPEIEIPDEEPHELIQKVIYPPRTKTKISKYSLAFLAMNAVAILFFVLFLKLTPSVQPFEVATLTDSIHTTWDNADDPMEKGTRLVTGNKRLLLREGYAELLFDNQARVTIEGPAEFQIVADDRISLNYGKLYSQVPKEAIGFSVYTQNSKIIDLGTEFGVEADFRGETQLHVMQGRTKLISGQQSDTTSIEVREGEAKKISAATSEISPISCESDLFVRKIDSKVGFVWKGQTRISLADIVGGGNGFNTGRINAGIHVATGKMLTDLPDDGVKIGPVGYKKVDSNPFIDGVFIPGLLDSAVPITADGSVSVKFPRTSGCYWGYICNGAFHQGEGVPRHTLRLNGKPFGTPENPSISIHSNQAITFDLSKVRDTLPDTGIKKFCSLIGISETVKAYVDEARVLDTESLSKDVCSTAEFWIFLDSRKVYELKMTNVDAPVQVDIPISAQDRYLTLAVTESDQGWAYDWALFGRPELIIEPTK